ncbi:hypothetical protein Mapa_003817 [Marchantia paleacea]|nr:hypothetical protein Mapa_003817 [Marchantia paleacea]
MLRSLSKVASTAGAAATAAVVSVSSAAAHAEFPMKKFREDAHSRLSKPSPGPNYIEDEYDFCHEDIYSALIGGVPSQEEVEEATRDLQATFVQNEENREFLDPKDRELKQESCDDVPIPDSDAECSSSKDLCHGDQGLLPPPTTEAEATTPAETSSDSLKPSTSTVERNIQAMTVRGTSSVVAHCVDLLQRDPDIQAAVVSLAKDPAIWDAFVKNEKVQELLRSRSTKLSLTEGTSSFKENSKAGNRGRDGKGRENPFVVALLCVKNLIFEVMDTFVDLVGNVFGFLDQKVFGGKDSDPLDKPLKACMVLTILVLALVVLKRV